MPEITIKNFKGLSFDNSLWAEGYSRYSSGVDVFGIQDTQSKLSYPGVIQCCRNSVAGTEAAATNDVTDIVRSFEFYPTSNSVLGMSGTSTPRLYERASGTWTMRKTTAVDLNAASGGGGLRAYNGRFFVFQDARISQQNGSDFTNGGQWTAAFATFTASTASPRPSVILAGNLYVGNNRYVSRIDSSFAFTAGALTLPADKTIKSIAVLGDYMYITADDSSGATAGTSSWLYIWDGISPNYISVFTIRDEVFAPNILVSNGIIWLVPNRASSSPMPIYTFNGSSFIRQMIVTITPSNGQVGTDFAVPYQGGILVASSDSGTADYELGTAGIWFIGRHSDQYPYSAVLMYRVSNGVTDTTVGGLYASGTVIYVGTQDLTKSGGAAFEIFEITNNNESTINGGIWQSLPITGENPSLTKIWHGIRIGSELGTDTASATRTIVIGYRLDNAISFTTLRTVTRSGSDQDAYFPIGRTSRAIEFQFNLGSPSAGLSTRMHSFTVYYSVINM